ncbi:MFS general substrate transporter [Pisolithus albus]|nr:MFS general substrate transporter [Pisolithus albus]KAI5994321.1 MFS general substrate transporter [Pisolithus albus]
MQKVTFKDSTAVFTLDEPRRPHEDAPEANLSVEELPYLWAAAPLAVSFEPEKPVSREIPDFPDGGMRAWSVVIGALLMSFGTFGWINSFGVFQTYYQQNTFQNQSASNISWIGSIQYGLIFIPALFTGRLLDLGYYNGPLAISSVFYIAALFLVAECKTFLQVILCQGVATGFFAGMLFGSTPAIVSHWFLKKRSQAFGVLAIGSSIGGTILPIITQQLFGKVGFKWSVRAVAFIITFAVIVANILLRPRLPPSNAKGGIFDWRAFKNPAFACCVLAYNVSLLGLYVPLIYLDLSGQDAGYSPNFTFYLISIANCASLIGRLSSGILADRFGALNTLIPFTLVGAIVSFAWPFATSSIASLVIVSIIYGCATGAFVSLIPSAPARLGGMNDAGRRIGMAITCMAFGATGGPPLAGVIRTKSGGFDDVGLYSGGVILMGCILLTATRYLALGKWVGKF